MNDIRRPIKAALLQVHSLAGLALALLWAVVGITGATMVFEDEIEASLNSHIMRVDAGATRRLTPDELVALMAFTGLAFSTAARADSGFVTLTIYKAGWFIGGSGGSGVLTFRGRSYRLSTGGLDYGLVFGGSKTVLRGRVSNINRPSDVAGVYGAAGAGLAVGRGARAIVLTNQKGAVLELTGHQVGLMANADLSGLAITMQ